MNRAERMRQARDLVASISTFVPREQYLKAVRGLSDARAAYHDERAKAAQADIVIRQQREYIAELERDRRQRAAEMTQIKVALGRVPVIGDAVGASSTARLVDAVVRDNEEHETRMEAALDVILARTMDGIDPETAEYATLNRIAGLLQGQVEAVPDTIEGVED